MQSRTYAMLAFLLCVLALPVTWIILEMGTEPGYAVYPITPSETPRAVAVTADSTGTGRVGRSSSEAAELWASAGRLCQQTPGCRHVQIEGRLKRSTLFDVRIRVYGDGSKVLQVDESYRDRKFTEQAMREVSKRVRVTP